MKYVILRCEDDARVGEQTTPLLEGAKSQHVQHLAQAGAGGTIRHRTDDEAVDRLHLHRALFGLKPQEFDATPARCYAASANFQLAEGETAWCAELVTHHDGKVIDATAGDIPTKESEILIRALNEDLGSETRRWVVGQGSHHMLVIRDPLLRAAGPEPLRAPELLVGHAWKRSLPRRPIGDALRLLIEQSAKVLESHPVNRVRVDLGENPANMVWLWGPSGDQPGRTFVQRTGLSGAMISSSFPMRGFAQVLGLNWNEGPTALDERSVGRLLKMTSALVERHDVTYVHVRIDSADPVERLCIMERLDQHLLKPLTETLLPSGSYRLLAVVDDRRSGAVPFVAIGSGLPQQPIVRLDAQSFAESPLTFGEGTALFSWFTKQ